MPLKYGLDILVVNKVLGMAHGALTIVFVLILAAVYANKKVSATLARFVFVASLIPFGAFVAEKKLLMSLMWEQKIIAQCMKH